MRYRSSPLPAHVVLLLSTCLISSFALADGYRNPPEGARAIGAFGGHRAFADDANATIHNSANLVDLDHPMIQINATFGYGVMKFHRPGVSDQTDDPFYAIPGLSIAVPFQDGTYALGLATYIPYGRSVDWNEKSYFAQNNYSYAGSMTVADITPNVAVRLNDSLSIGIGADFYYGKVEQETIFNPFVAPFPMMPPGSKSTLKASGDAIGWNAAVTWKLTENQRLAATYRSPFTIDYEGDNELSIGLTGNVSADIEYPAIAGLAYGIELSDTLRVEINGEWIDFSQYETLTINDSLLGKQKIPQRLKETWTAGIGIEWEFVPQWTLRSGFMYLENPTPDDTYSPLGPDENQEVISIGLGYETEHHAIDLGYAYGIFDGRTVSGSVNSPNGTYDYAVQLLSLSYGYKF